MISFSVVTLLFSIAITAFDAFCNVIIINGYLEKKYHDRIRSSNIAIAFCLTAFWLLPMLLNIVYPIGITMYFFVIGAKICTIWIFYSDFSNSLKTVIFLSIISTAIALLIDLVLLFTVQIITPLPLNNIKTNYY